MSYVNTFFKTFFDFFQTYKKGDDKDDTLMI